MDESVDRLSIRDHLERLMPAGGRGRRLVGWGVVAWTGIGAAIVLYALAKALSRLANVFPYLVVAAMVVFVLNPLVRKLVAWGLARRLAATIVFAAAVMLVVGLVDLLVPIIIHQSQSLVGSAPGLVRKGGNLFDGLTRSHDPVLHRIGMSIQTWLHDHAGNAPKALNTLTAAGLKLAHVGIVLVLGGFLGFLLLLSLPETTRGILAMVPPGSRDAWAAPLDEVRRIVSGYVRARLIVSAAVGLIATIGLFLVHLQFWLILGIVVGVANLVPMLGSWIGGAPVALVAILTRPPSFLFVVLAVVVFAHVIDGYILSPIILKETTNLHPVVILLAVILGAELLGFWGILAAIPVAGVIHFFLRESVFPRMLGTAPPAPPPPAGEPAIGVSG
jgi:predicted PurR-regulated permease PerM